MGQDRSLSAYAVSLTPFTKTGEIDEAGLRAHFKRLAAARIGVYVAGGGTGEGFTLSKREMRRVLEIAKEELHGIVPVRAMGVEPSTAAEMIEFVALSEDVGLDATHVYSLDLGHGSIPNERIIEAYLTDVLEAANGPIVLASHHLTGYLLPVDILRKLADRFDNFIGMNVAGPPRYALQVVESIGERVQILTSLDTALDTFALGAHGFAVGEANLAPSVCVAIAEHYAAGRLAEAREAYLTMMRLLPLARDFGGISGTKAALRLMGLPAGYTRKPRLEVTDEQLVKIGALIDELGLRELEQAAAAA